MYLVSIKFFISSLSFSRFVQYWLLFFCCDNEHTVTHSARPPVASRRRKDMPENDRCPTVSTSGKKLSYSCPYGQIWMRLWRIFVFPSSWSFLLLYKSNIHQSIEGYCFGLSIQFKITSDLWQQSILGVGYELMTLRYYLVLKL